MRGRPIHLRPLKPTKRQLQVKAMRALAEEGNLTASEIAFSVGVRYEWCLKVIADLPYKRTEPVMEYAKEREGETIFQAIVTRGDCEDFVPTITAAFQPTDAPPGSDEKVAILRRRVELGQPLWHEDDRIDFAGLTVGMPEGSDTFTAAGRAGSIKVCPVPSGGKALST